jgi:ferredoxin-NADP reductase
MPTAGSTAPQTAAGRDHGFHPLRIARVVPETAEASSLVLEVPAELAEAFAYRAGQFCTFRVHIDGQQLLRCYSMSSSPDAGDELAVTVKRVPEGSVSNWMLDTLRAGDVVETTCPAGVFCLGPETGPILVFAAGSGITPVYSIVKTALATTERPVRLLYANRDRDAVIFAEALTELAERHPDRLEVEHHLDIEQGFVDEETVRRFAGADREGEYFVCGPEPFMNLVEAELLGTGVDGSRIRLERFTPAATEEEPGPAPSSGGDSTVTIEFDGRTDQVEHRPGTTILQTARQMGMAPPFSCESGNCATCMARLVEGTVSMRVNNALDEDEVADGWVLTCQSEPTSPSVHIVYEEV